MTRARPCLALCTSSEYPTLFEDERELPARLAAAGLDAEPVIWSDPAVDWSRFDRVIIRSTWDYFTRIDEFRAWLDRMQAANVPLWNPAALVRWNLDKHYLAELAARGVAVVPTRYVDAPESLAALVADAGWSDAILKPAISGGSWRTHRFAAADAPSLQADLDALATTGGALVQPFAREIVDEGEWSFLFFGGELSHVVVKTPAAHDFRVQPKFGGTFVAVTAPPSLRAQADAILAQLPIKPLYARIDGIRRGDQLLLMEVEVIEPYLYLPADPASPDRYVRALVAHCNAK
jgi:glutathione synthase/RimK-type ligase-like ATP-grasp enzyme